MGCKLLSSGFCALLLYLSFHPVGASAQVSNGRSASNHVPRPFYSPEDRRIMDRAFEVMASREAKPIRDFKESMAPVLVRLPKMVCVGLIGDMFPGNNYTVCFDSHGEKLISFNVW
jgi:hypothetical protein